MGVDGDGRLVKGDVEHDIRRLAADARQRDQFVKGLWHHALMTLDQQARQRHDIFRLRAKQTDGLDRLADFFFAEGRHFGGRIGLRKKGRRRLIDPGVCRLSRKHDGDKQREGVGVIEFAFWLGIGGGEARENFLDAPGLGGADTSAGRAALALYIALKISVRSARASETLDLTPLELGHAKIGVRGHRREWRFNPSWVRLEQETHEEFGVQRLALASRGERVEIGAFLGPDQKAELARELRGALATARQGPRFD